MFSLTGAEPTAEQLSIVNAVLAVALESGFTPSAAASRVPYKDTTDSLQARVGTALLSAGDNVFTQAEITARLLDRVLVKPSTRRQEAEYIVKSYRDTRRQVPGFGHHLHREGDPRARALIELAADLGVPGHHLSALSLLADAVEESHGRPVLVNAAGAIATVLGEVGMPTQGFGLLAVTARAAGLSIQTLTSARPGNSRNTSASPAAEHGASESGGSQVQG